MRINERLHLRGNVLLPPLPLLQNSFGLCRRLVYLVLSLLLGQCRPFVLRIFLVQRLEILVFLCGISRFKVFVSPLILVRQSLVSLYTALEIEGHCPSISESNGVSDVDKERHLHPTQANV